MVAVASFTVAVIGRETGAAIVAPKWSVVGNWRQTPGLSDSVTASTIRWVVDASPTRDEATVAVVHASGTSIPPVMVWMPFLNTSCRVTEWTAAMGAGDFACGTSRVCGTDSTKPIKITTAIIAAEMRGRRVVMRQ